MYVCMYVCVYVAMLSHNINSTVTVINCNSLKLSIGLEGRKLYWVNRKVFKNNVTQLWQYNTIRYDTIRYNTIQYKLYRQPIGTYALFLLNRVDLTSRALVQTRCRKGLFTTYVRDDRTREADRYCQFIQYTGREKGFFLRLFRLPLLNLHSNCVT